MPGPLRLCREMEIRLLFRHIRFPGVAGELQDAGSLARLVIELGDSYAPYHAYLAELARMQGGWPDGDQAGVEAAAQAWDFLQAIGHAEIFLRNCRDFRSHGAALDRPLDAKTPLVRDGKLELLAG